MAKEASMRLAKYRILILIQFESLSLDSVAVGKSYSFLLSLSASTIYGETDGLSVLCVR